MVADLSMSPPPATQYIALKRKDTVAVYRFQTDRIYNFAHPDWVRTFMQTSFTEDFFQAVGIRVCETDRIDFPLTLTPSEMSDIISPKPKEYVGKHRKV